MHVTTFHVERMDCAAEEQVVRLALERLGGVERLAFDLPARRLTVYHTADPEALREAVGRLGMGAREVAGGAPGADAADTIEALGAAEAPGTQEERRALWLVFGINGVLFAGEVVAGFLAGSMGLVADALDMLADALVYGLSLSAVGAAASRKVRAARLSGFLQLALAVGGLVEVVRRFVSPAAVPEPVTMIVVSLVALAGNVVALRILLQARSREAHVEASRIFTSNDVKVNLLVIMAGVAVIFSASKVPDLVAGGLIFVIVANGARRILALTR
jgi:Co/Zn/Cd efflux system component